VLTPLGFAPQAQAIRAAFERGDYDGMVKGVTDDMVDALSLAGTKDDVRRQVQQFDGLFDRLILAAPFFGVGVEETRSSHQGIVEAFFA
jgi:alkanesulfonate monooxygenase SsuD/methylene tetrahydromethanopterin reductase-like flavin-dependent oxidoreductase (luciferase family)